MIIRSSGETAETFKSAGLELTSAGPIVNLLDTDNVKADEFIDKLSNLFFNAGLAEGRRVKFIQGLKDGTLTVDGLVQRLLKESSELDY
jgi:sugar phosphate isomerase/epimerase